jgi:hypothetical protein
MLDEFSDKVKGENRMADMKRYLQMMCRFGGKMKIKLEKS